MLSKRGKANGKANAKKAPRTARANQKSKAKPSRPRKTQPSRSLRSSVTSMVAPVAMGLIQRNSMFRWRFGAAAPHDEFPEGGLRIAGVLPGSSNTATLTQDTANLGLFGTAGLPAAGVHPSGVTTSNMVDLFSSTGPLAVFAQFFRKYRFRKLSGQVDTMITTGGALGANSAATVLGSPVIQLTLEKDVWTADQVAGAAGFTIDNSVQSTNCTRFNAWANDVTCPLINQSSSDRSDELYYCDAAGDVITSAASSAELRQQFQGAVVATANAVNTLADLKLSKVLWHFEIDLYGFTNIAASVEPLKPPVLRTREGKSHDRGDFKRPVDQPDADLTDFVSLTPRSNRLKVVTTVEPELQRQSAPPSVQGARISSKK